MTKKKINFDITLENKKILGFYLREQPQGFIFGLRVPTFDIHLTTLYNSEKGLIQPHITDNTLPENRRRQPWGQHTDIKLILDDLEKHLRSWIKYYHPNQKAWQISSELWMKINMLINPLNKKKSSIEFPIEYLNIELPPLVDGLNYTRVRIKECVGTSTPIIIRGEMTDWFGYVIDERKMICFSENQLNKVTDRVLNTLGFLQYFDYIKNRIPRKKLIQS